MIRQPSGSPAALALDVSIDTFTIAGINAHVYGLSQLPQSGKMDNAIEVSALHLLNPRLCDHTYMAGIAKTVLADFYQTQTQGSVVEGRGLICVAFDQRNHGEREVKSLANQDWRSSNPTHAADMFSIYHGTSLDLTQLITYLPAYLFPRRHSAHTLVQHLVAGVSLGGHAAYLSLLHEPRITAGVVVIGCPDYLALMAHRAARSGIAGGVTGAAREFPEDLTEVVKGVDPAAMGVGEIVRRGLLQGKKVLTLSGGADRLVPVACAEGFWGEVRAARERGEWTGEWRDVVCEGVGHECTPEMVRELSKAVNRWVEEAAAAAAAEGKGEGKTGEGVQSVL